MIISWGKKIFFLYTTFALSMIFLVYKCCQVNYDLVSKDYYKEELAYQELIDGSVRSSESAGMIRLKQVEKGVLINFEDFSNLAEITGDCHFYYAPDAAVDFKVKLASGTDSTQFISHDFQKGSYIVKLGGMLMASFITRRKNLLSNEQLGAVYHGFFHGVDKQPSLRCNVRPFVNGASCREINFN